MKIDKSHSVMMALFKSSVDDIYYNEDKIIDNGLPGRLYPLYKRMGDLLVNGILIEVGMGQVMGTIQRWIGSGNWNEDQL